VGGIFSLVLSLNIGQHVEIAECAYVIARCCSGRIQRTGDCVACRAWSNTALPEWPLTSWGKPGPGLRGRSSASGLSGISDGRESQPSGRTNRGPAEGESEHLENLASHRRCAEHIQAAWPGFAAKRDQRLEQQRRLGEASEKVAENILEDPFTAVLDWPQPDWLGFPYQSAYRLACLCFLWEPGKIDAFLANVYFTGDPHSPATRQEWDEGIRAVTEQLGIGSPMPYSASVFLEATR